MSQRAKSRAQYEDDLLALLMDGLLEEEGLALLEENERLNADPEAAVPADLDEKCRALLQSSFPNEPLKKAGRVTLKVLKRMLVAAVVAAALFATAYAAVPEFRAGVLRIITNITDFGTEFYFRSTGTETSAPTSANSLIIKDGMPFEFTYIPEGYEIDTREAFDGGVFGTDYLCIYFDPNDDSNSFIFEINCIGEETGVLLDTEDAQVTEMKIRGYDGYHIQKTHSISGKNIISYAWFDLENELMFQYSSIGISAEESQRIFDGIVIYGYETDTPAPTPAPSSPLVIKDGMPFEFSYVPEGYEQITQEAYDWGGNGMMYQRIYGYPNDDPNNFDFSISSISEGTGLSVDTEDSTVTHMKIHGFDGQLIRKIDALSERECVAYLWFDLENQLMYFYNSVGVPFEESQRIFDGIVIYGYETDTPAPTPAPSSPLVIKDGMPFEFSYVPEGYELYSNEVYDAGALGISYRCVYVDPHDKLNSFAFDIEPIDESAGVLLDTENAQVTEMKIRGYDGYLIQKTYAASGGNIISYVWFDLEDRLMFNYYSVGFSLEESQRIFDGIVIYE